MYLKKRTWFLVGLICLLGGAACFWRFGTERDQGTRAPAAAVNATFPLLSSARNQLVAATASNSPRRTNAPFPHRISNTTRPIGELVRSDSAILLRNALIDTLSGAPLEIPPHLRSQGDPGTYIVQAAGRSTEAFREQLKTAGVEVVSYVPNNAYLVRANAAAVAQLRGLPSTQAVLPWEPYYKLAPKLLALAVEQQPLPNGNPLSVLTFPNDGGAAEGQLRELGATVVGREQSPFGEQLLIHTPPDQLVSVAQLGSVQAIEPAYRRVLANDLARTTVRVSTNTITPNNHLDLKGTGIRVGVNDTGVDAGHPDLSPRVSADPASTGVDVDGHGTHVAGIIASSGNSITGSTNIPGSTNGASFRGMAPEARIFAQPIDLISGPLKPDSELQEVGATNGVFISNNSWGYLGAFDYTFAAAQWDSAVRDSVPGQQGPQSVTYVFSAGNTGFGNNGGTGGLEDSIGAPATAKNVITVGALEQIRNITNEIVINGVTNTPFADMTDSSSQVASFSSRGNVGPGTEGEFGRFKPDVVAPGVFVASTRANGWVSNLNVIAFAGYLRDEVVLVGDTNIYFFFGAPNVIEARIRVIPNGRSPVPFPTNSIYLRRGSPPPPSDIVSMTNVLNFGPVADDIYYLGIGNNFNQDVHYDLQVIVVATNPPTAGDEQLVTLNQALEPHYRYESGTSMAAPVVSGVLALMQQQLQARGVTNPSPALMKALLINGARSIGNYDVDVNKFLNLQGWGLINITNSLPALSATVSDSAQWPVRFFDQSIDGLVSGESETRIVTLASNAPVLRVSLVWTDPPGNPAVASKLVNDLDLIVTNLSTVNNPGGPIVYVGNAISGDVSFPIGTNFLTDVINNVENVIIGAPQPGRYSVTVRAKQVNVNAVTAHNPDGIAQDYALVISAGSPGSAPTFTVDPVTTTLDPVPLVTVISNGAPVFDQRIGANPNITPTTNGLAKQWRFYEFHGSGGTNTNVSFFVFFSPNLSRPRTIEEADIDLYVSTDSSLTNLNPIAIGSAWTSKGRGGTEGIGLTNQSTPTTYYIGVKSEDQQASSFGLVGFADSRPFAEEDEQGNVTLFPRGTLPVPLLDGSSEQPFGTNVFFFCDREIDIRNVIVTNTMTHENGGDLIGFLDHLQRRSVLNNHRAFEGTKTFIYDDSNSGQILASTPTDHPGSLTNFWAQQGLGAWQMVMIDDSLVGTGAIENATITLQPRIETNDFFSVEAILLGRWFYTFVNVPADASKLAIDVVPENGPVELYVRHRFVPDRVNYDQFALFNPPTGGTLEVTPQDSPPLRSGIYFIGLFNPGPANPLNVRMRIRLERNLFGSLTNLYQPTASIPLLDDALTTALLSITNSQLISDVRVGVRIEHQRASDLVLTLVSPGGTRVLLAENRGGSSPFGYGGGPFPPDTNYVYTVFTDSTNYTLTPIKFAQGPFTNQTCTNIALGTGPQVMFDGFEAATCGLAKPAGSVQSGWTVDAGEVDILCDNTGFTGAPHTGLQALDLNGFNPGTISRTFPTVPGRLYVLSHVYCRNPNSGLPNFTAFADVVIDNSVVRSLSYGPTNTASALNWATNLVSFVASSNTTELKFVSRVPTVDPACGTPCSGMYFDTVQVNEGVFVSGGCNNVWPEEPLTQMRGENAYGTWRLEVLDNRVGAPLNASLLSWQLEFDFVNTNPPPTVLSNGMCFTGIAYGTNNTYFRIVVPSIATAATNSLTSSNGTVMVLGADINMLPAGAQPPDDYAPVLTSAPIPELVITTGSTPRLPQGQTYYLSVRNDSNTTNHFTLCVKFDQDDTNALNFLPIASGQCITNVIPATNILQYYQFDVDSNAVELTFELLNLSENVDLVVSRPGSLPPNSTTFYKQSAQPGRTDELITETNYNFTLGGRWYIGVYNSTNVPVEYRLCVRQNLGIRYTNVDVCTNGVLIPERGVQYFMHTVPPTALRTHFTVSNIFGNVDMFITPFPPFPPPGEANFLLAGTNPGTTPEIAALSWASMPQLIPGGTYYIAITNRLSSAGSYDLCIFDFPGYVPLSNAVCFKSTLVDSNDAQYFVFNVASNAVRADFQTLGATGDIDLYLRQFPIPGPFPDYDYPSEQVGTGNETIVLTTNTTPFPLQPGNYYLAVVSRTNGPVDFCIQATQTPAVNIRQISCTNAVTIAANSVHYYDYAVSSDALRVVIQATNLSGNVDMYVGDFATTPFPGPDAFSEASTNPGNADEIIVHSLASGLTPPLTYRIAITNLEGADVTYSLCVIETTNYIVLANNICFSNSLFNSEQLDAQYYAFDVDPNAIQVEFATFSAQDVELYVRRTPPPGTVLGPYDYASANPGTGNELVIINTNSSPALAPGRWYAAVEYRDPGAAQYCIRAKQIVVPDLTASPCTNDIVQPGELRYYQFRVSPNAFQVEFQTTMASGDIDLYINAYPPLNLPGPGNALRASATPGTGDESIVLSSSSIPQLQTPGTYFIAISNASIAAVNFQFCATQTTNGLALTNGVCVTNTLAAMNDAHYYQVTIFSNSVRADFMTLGASGNVDLYVRRVVPPAPGPSSADHRGENSGTTNEIIIVTTSSTPVPLAPGEWYMAVVNREPGAVTYCMKVSQYPVLDPFNIRLRITNGSPSHMDLWWNAFEFQRFHLEWTPSLTSPWQPFSNANGPIEFGPVGGTGTNFFYRDEPLIGPMRFYRLNILP